MASLCFIADDRNLTVELRVRAGESPVEAARGVRKIVAYFASANFKGVKFDGGKFHFDRAHIEEAMADFDLQESLKRVK